MCELWVGPGGQQQEVLLGEQAVILPSRLRFPEIIVSSGPRFLFPKVWVNFTQQTFTCCMYHTSRKISPSPSRTYKKTRGFLVNLYSPNCPRLQNHHHAVDSKRSLFGFLSCSSTFLVIPFQSGNFPIFKSDHYLLYQRQVSLADISVLDLNSLSFISSSLLSLKPCRRHVEPPISTTSSTCPSTELPPRPFELLVAARPPPPSTS